MIVTTEGTFNHELIESIYHTSKKNNTGIRKRNRTPQ